MAQEDKNLAPNLLSTHQHSGLDGTKRIKGTHLLTHVLFGATAATAANYSVFFNVPFPCEVISVRESHTALATSGSPVTITVEKLTGTSAPGAGVGILASALSLRAAINTVQTGTLTSTKPNRRFLAGHRLASVLVGDPTALTDVTLTIELLEL